MFSVEYRPFKFTEMIGQKGIIHEMSNRSKELNYPNVMIFEGNSGTGKTTLAFIISAILNCENPIEDSERIKSPCGDCISCRSIIEQKFIRDVHFFDASQMGKDNVLSLDEIAHSAPMYDKNKIIIIDEAQELSHGGKGATLNLLEKKRINKNLFFIMCTMNIQSFDSAILSRGQVYKFRKVDRQFIAKYLYDLLKKEGIDETVPEEFVNEGVFTLSESCDGNVRVAIQNFERCLNGEFFTEEKIMEEFGFFSMDTLFDIAIRILKKDKTILKDIIEYDIKEIYYKLFKVYLDSAIYGVTGSVKEKWKESNCKSICSYETLSEVLTFFSNSVNSYFRKNVFLVNLINFLNSNPVPILHPEEKTASRRKKV